MLKNDKLKIIRQWYPNAMPTVDNTNKLIDFAVETLKLKPSQVILADSICSDDVNNIQYPARARELLGPFKMGGLDGYPFTGLTGMNAFSSHVPDHGAVAIYYGPHIGITKSGALGEISRAGQSKNSSCCGAARAATFKLLNDQIKPGEITDIDYQMNILEQVLFNQKERIVSAKEPIFEATEVVYEAIESRIDELMKATTFKCKYVLLVGVILINSDSDMGSFASARRTTLIDLATGEIKNIEEF